MASTPTIRNDGTLFHFLKLPTELRHRVYRFVVPYIIPPPESSSQMGADEKKSFMALLVINKQINEEVCYVLYQYSHFLISINSRRVACVALDASILWELDQTERMSIILASKIRHIDIDLEWVERRRFGSAIAMNLRLIPLLQNVCDHLSAFRCLQTLRVGWRKDGGINSRPRVEHAIFLLAPLEQLQEDLPRLQITVRATKQQDGSNAESNPSDSETYVKLQDYISELRRVEEAPIAVKKC